MGSKPLFTIDNIIEKTSTWVRTGALDPAILSDEFQFSSPFHKEKNKAQFLADFKDKTFYKDDILSNIINFDPLLYFKGTDASHFAMIFQYHTKFGHSVWETVLGKIDKDGLLVELRSIYDLEATKKAHQF